QAAAATKRRHEHHGGDGPRCATHRVTLSSIQAGWNAAKSAGDPGTICATTRRCDHGSWAVVHGGDRPSPRLTLRHQPDREHERRIALLPLLVLLPTAAFRRLRHREQPLSEIRQRVVFRHAVQRSALGSRLKHGHSSGSCGSTHNLKRVMVRCCHPPTSSGSSRPTGGSSFAPRARTSISNTRASPASSRSRIRRRTFRPERSRASPSKRASRSRREPPMQYDAFIHREGKQWLAEFPDCPGCQTFAESVRAVTLAAHEALEGWLEANLSEGRTPPRPVTRSGAPAGRKLVRVPVRAGLTAALTIRWARTDQ